MPDRVVATERHDDRNGRRRLLGRADGRRAHGRDHVWARSNEFRSKCGKVVEPTVGQTHFQHQILPFNVAQVSQCSAKSLEDTARCGEIAHTVHLAPGLRRSTERGDEEPSHGAEERPPMHYSITSSTRASSDGRSTGISLGALPVRILTAVVPATIDRHHLGAVGSQRDHAVLAASGAARRPAETNARKARRSITGPPIN